MAIFINYLFLTMIEQDQPGIFSLQTLSNTNPTFRYGKTEGQSVEGTKSIKKAKRKLESMVDIGVLSPVITITESGLVHTKNGDVYPHVLNGRKSMYLRPDVFKKEFQNQITDLSVITGCCLFGEQHAQGITNKGRVISLVNKNHTNSLENEELIAIQTQQYLHLYEIDTITRIAQTMQIVGNGDNNISPVLHIPEVEYWLYLYDLHERDQISSELLYNWCKNVSKHATYLGNTFAKRIQKETHTQVKKCDPFGCIKSDLMSELSQGNLLQLNDIMESLAGQNPVWEEQLQKQTPMNYTDLSQMANVIVYASELQYHQGVLGVENPEEAQILDYTSKSVPLHADQFLGAVYVHPQVFIPHESMIIDTVNDGAEPIYDLYYINQHTGIGVAKTIISTNS